MRGVLLLVVLVSLGAGGCKKKPKPAPGTKDGGVVKVDDGGSGPRAIPRPADRIVDPEVFDRARLEGIEKLGFEQLLALPKLCLRPRPVTLASIDVDRSLFVHDRATLDGADFSLMRTLKQIADQSVLAGADPAATTPQNLFRDLWDTQNSVAAAATPAGAHCDDDGTTLNGFPNECRPGEGAQATAADLTGEIAKYHAIALVNRLDLAAEGWRNCGEHRIVYGRNDGNRNFIIFEAVLPNPRPGCQSGCRAVALHWHKLSAIADPVARAVELEKLFYAGLPGFRPVVHVDHYAATGSTGAYGSSGSGQIRTNQFMQGPWMLKEFKLALDCSTSPCELDAVPLPVALNPFGELWIENAAPGLANDFQQNVVLPAATAAALAGPAGTFSYQVPGVFNGARSDAQSGKMDDHYVEAYTNLPGVPGGFRTQLAAAAGGVPGPFTDMQLVRRALALSCAGCHQPAGFGLTAPDAIGPGQSFPNSLGFVHTLENATAGVHQLSPALINEFLPARRQHLFGLLNERVCLCRPKRVPLDLAPFQDRLARRQIEKLEELRTAEETLTRELNVELRRTQQPELPPLAVSLKAQPLVLDSVKAAGPDPKARAAARRTAVHKLLADEPPRKTVTGHFRTH